MPTISVFYGIVIRMHWRDHNPPHFHAIEGEHIALIDIQSLEVIRGSLPNRVLAMVIDWANQHQDELMEDWTLCAALKEPNPIEPLK